MLLLPSDRQPFKASFVQTSALPLQVNFLPVNFFLLNEPTISYAWNVNFYSRVTVFCVYFFEAFFERETSEEFTTIFCSLLAIPPPHADPWWHWFVDEQNALRMMWCFSKNHWYWYFVHCSNSHRIQRKLTALSSNLGKWFQIKSGIVLAGLRKCKAVLFVRSFPFLYHENCIWCFLPQ